MTTKTKTSMVSIKVEGYVTVPVSHSLYASFEEIYEKANKIVEEMDFGELEEISWKNQEIVE